MADRRDADPAPAAKVKDHPRPDPRLSRARRALDREEALVELLTRRTAAVIELLARFPDRSVLGARCGAVLSQKQVPACAGGPSPSRPCSATDLANSSSDLA